MNRAAALVLTVVTVPVTIWAASPLLTLTERDQDGGTTALGNDISIVDINSVIELKLERTALSEQAVALGAKPLPEGLVVDLKLLSSALEQGAAAIAPLNEAWARFNATRDEKALRSATQVAASAFLSIVQLANTEGFQGEAALRRRRFREALDVAIGAAAKDNLPSGRRLAAYVEVARMHISNMRRELEASAPNGFYIQLGAWVATKAAQRAVHLPGFDVYPEGERFTVERWSITLTEEQRRQLKQMTDLAQSINEKGFAATARAAVKSAAEAILQTSQSALEDATAAIESFRTSASASANSLKTPLDAVVQDITALRDLLAVLRGKYTGSSPASSATSLLEGAVADFQVAAGAVKKLASDVTVLRSQLATEATKGIVAATTLSNALEQAKNALEKALSDKLGILGDSLTGVFGVSRLAEEAMAFGKEVQKLDLASVPEGTLLDLVSTGRREPGDLVVIKLALGGPDGTRNQALTRRFTMHRVLVHLETTVSVLFASPLAKTEVKGPFQAAPSYSVLIRCGSRKHPLVNTLWTPGIGLNLTALNFRHNDTPELGVGVVFSFLRDFVQVGFGYNVFADRAYGFFGLGLPLPNLGGLSGPNASIGGTAGSN